MKGLTKVLFAAGAVVAATEIANEVLGVSTKADTWYKGKTLPKYIEKLVKESE